MKNKALTSLAILLCTITSCIENISIDSRKEMPVVVNCILKMDTVQTMQLYQMRVLSEKKNNPIENAQVYLQKNGETVAEFHKEEGINWEARFQPEYGMHTAEVRKGRYYDEWQGLKENDGSPFKAYMTVSESPCKIWIYSHTDTTSVSPGRRSLHIKIHDKDDFILSSYDYENLPSNINGGVGIFGADNATWDMEETVTRIRQRDGSPLIWEELCPNAPKETK